MAGTGRGRAAVPACPTSGRPSSEDRSRRGRPSREIENVSRILELAGRLAGWDGLSSAAKHSDAGELVALLNEAERSARDALTKASTPAERAPLAALIVQIGREHVLVREAEDEQRLRAVSEARGALDRLAVLSDVNELFQSVPDEVGRIGYDRCMVSHLREGRWVAVSSYVDNDPQQAAAITEVARRAARPVDSSLVESDMLRRARPILVLNAQENLRVHPELRANTWVASYAAAPIVVGRSVVGLLHADSTASGRTADRFDQALLGVLGEGVGCAMEKLLLQHRLLAIRDQAMDLGGSTADLVAEVIAVGPEGRRAGHDPLRATTANQDPRLRSLSAREVEILDLMARGMGNHDVARRLTIAETTVKTHIRHILRKTGFANRAGAVAAYLGTARAGSLPA